MATKSQLKAMQQRRAQAVSRGQAQSIRPKVTRGLPQSIRPESIGPDVALPHALSAQALIQQERLRGQGVLRVLVRRASGLRGADRGGTSSDPYVVVKIGSQEQRTRTIVRDLNPVWAQTLEFRGSSLTDLLGQNLSLSVKDHDEISRDDHLGNLVLPLRHQLEYADTKELSLDLPTQGTLHLQLQWQPLAAPGVVAAPSQPPPPPPSRLPPPPAKRDVPAGRLEQRGTLRVHLHRASGIKAADLGTTLKTLTTGTSDPFVTVSLLERKARSQVSGEW